MYIDHSGPVCVRVLQRLHSAQLAVEVEFRNTVWQIALSEYIFLGNILFLANWRNERIPKIKRHGHVVDRADSGVLVPLPSRLLSSI